MSARIITGQAFERGALKLLARIENEPGEVLNQASTDSISLSVFDVDNELVDGPTDVTVADVIFDTLQVPWDVDRIGYSFRYEPDRLLLEEVGTYYFEFKFTPASGDAFWIIYKVPTVKVRTPE